MRICSCTSTSYPFRASSSTSPTNSAWPRAKPARSARSGEFRSEPAPCWRAGWPIGSARSRCSCSICAAVRVRHWRPGRRRRSARSSRRCSRWDRSPASITRRAWRSSRARRPPPTTARCASARLLSSDVSTSFVAAEETAFHAPQYAMLVTVNVLFGFVYAALMTFLPRYLTEADLQPASVAPKQWGALCAAGVLFCGMVGQGIAGKLCRPDRLRPLMTTVLLLNVPCLVAMSLAEGKWRLVAACVTGLFHFMHQPVFNSFLAQLVPRSRRSVGYGFSQMMQFGVGGLGAQFAGSIKASALENPDFVNYVALAGVALVAAGLASQIRALPQPESA
ncbi:MAG: hypothetical protein DCC68_21135 [Planctomycetota bacterium]|nr:MAG: hypothetical protein DCC68_21135 [Planctomycetota bacterium]